MTVPIRAARTPRPNDPLLDLSSVAPEHRPVVPRYGDASWSLLALNGNPSAANDIIHWDRVPASFLAPLKRIAWALVTEQLPEIERSHLGRPMRAKLSLGRIYRTVKDWQEFARWLSSRRVDTLGRATADDMTSFMRSLIDRGLARNTAAGHLVGLTRLHLYSTQFLDPDDRLVEPPWVKLGMDDFLPPASLDGENATEPITPETLGPLLIWALRLVDDCSQDILAARAERRRLLTVVHQASAEPSSAADPDGARLAAALQEICDSAAPMPVYTCIGRTSIDAAFLAGSYGTPLRRVHTILRPPRWREYALSHPGRAIVDVPIRGTIDGVPWCEGIEFTLVDRHVKHLVDACFIVLSYLTGMRTGEVLGLEYGCCPEPDASRQSPSGAVRHLIYGRQFKNAKDERGNHNSAGVVREAPWVAIPPVVRAIRVLEAIVGPGNLLFDACIHDKNRKNRLRQGRAMSGCTIANRLERTVAWFNMLATSHGRQADLIPPDPHGRIGTARFRRTLAWHIARRPGGLVALAVQYGHMRTTITEGYASRARNGIHDLLDIETARAAADTLSAVHDSLAEGGGVSGPAARRLIHAATERRAQFIGMITTPRQARSMLSDPHLNVFDNPTAFLTCNYDPKRALCRRTGRETAGSAPSLDRCRDNCTNIARTDEHARHMLDEADRLETEVNSGLLPQPIAERLTVKAGDLRRRAQQHQADRLTTEEIAT